MTDQTRKTIAIDIDDVTANTLDTVRLWANDLTGASLKHSDYHTNDDYWNYYNTIWERHGLSDKLNFNAFLTLLETDQSSILTNDKAGQVIRALKKKFDIVFISSRPMSQKDATRKWLDEHIDKEIPLYIASNPAVGQSLQSKGELCQELGASLLIDDNVAHCENAQLYDTDVILFGFYGWNEHAPESMKRCKTWQEVEDSLLYE